MVLDPSLLLSPLQSTNHHVVSVCVNVIINNVMERLFYIYSSLQMKNTNYLSY